MHLRYREQTWDAVEPVEAALARRRYHHLRGNRAKSSGIAPSSPLRRLPTVDLLGVQLHAIKETECINHILDELAAGRGGVVVTPNLDHLRRYLNDVNFG